MQHARAQEPIEMSLREQLLAESGSGSGPAPYPTASAAPPQGHEHLYPQSSDAGAHHHRLDLDPNVTGQPLPYAMSEDNDDGLSPDSRKGKRELSTSKRAAQNRAAQRAFRQRKEGYIKKLEEQVKELQNMEHNFKALQNENYQLREYILNLQSKLLENHAEFPPAPAHMTLSSGAQDHRPNPSAESSYNAEQQLRREMEQRPPAAPVVAREDVIHRDGLSQLQAAAAQHEQQRTQQSPYGLGGDYSRPPQPEDARPHSTDSKPSS